MNNEVTSRLSLMSLIHSMGYIVLLFVLPAGSLLSYIEHSFGGSLSYLLVNRVFWAYCSTLFHNDWYILQVLREFDDEASENEKKGTRKHNMPMNC